jgi:HEPN domain-containing protein
MKGGFSMSDPEKKPVETPAAWIRFADENLAVAEREMDSDDPAHHTVCFLCQSASSTAVGILPPCGRGAAEKYLKGYLIAQGWDLEKTHDLVALLTRCADYEESFSALREGGAVLNEYIVAGRYPDDLAHEEIGDVEAAEAVTIARRIEEKVRSNIEEE